MTVAELIARLSEFPPDLPVIVNGTRNELANGQDAETVEILDQSRRHGDTWDVEYYPDQPPFWDDDERHTGYVAVAGVDWDHSDIVFGYDGPEGE